MPPVSRETLNARIETYFHAVRRADLPTLMPLIYEEFFANLRPLSCTIPNRAIDSEAGKVVTEQIYVGEVKDGSRIEMDNCNFFDFNEAGLIVRIVNWSSSRPCL